MAQKFYDFSGNFILIDQKCILVDKKFTFNKPEIDF